MSPASQLPPPPPPVHTMSTYHDSESLSASLLSPEVLKVKDTAAEWIIIILFIQKKVTDTIILWWWFSYYISHGSGQ